MLQITGRKWSHIFCCNSEYLLDSSSKYKGHCGSQQELHPKFFKPLLLVCSNGCWHSALNSEKSAMLRSFKNEKDGDLKLIFPVLYSILYYPEYTLFQRLDSKYLKMFSNRESFRKYLELQYFFLFKSTVSWWQMLWWASHYNTTLIMSSLQSLVKFLDQIIILFG